MHVRYDALRARLRLRLRDVHITAAAVLERSVSLAGFSGVEENSLRVEKNPSDALRIGDLDDVVDPDSDDTVRSHSPIAMLRVEDNVLWSAFEFTDVDKGILRLLSVDRGVSELVHVDPKIAVGGGLLAVETFGRVLGLERELLAAFTWNHGDCLSCKRVGDRSGGCDSSDCLKNGACDAGNSVMPNLRLLALVDRSVRTGTGVLGQLIRGRERVGPTAVVSKADGGKDNTLIVDRRFGESVSIVCGGVAEKRLDGGGDFGSNDVVTFVVTADTLEKLRPRRELKWLPKAVGSVEDVSASKIGEVDKHSGRRTSASGGVDRSHTESPHVGVSRPEDGWSLCSILQVADKAWDTRNSPASNSASDNSLGTTGVPGGLACGLSSVCPLAFESACGPALVRHIRKTTARKMRKRPMYFLIHRKSISHKWRE